MLMKMINFKRRALDVGRRITKTNDLPITTRDALELSHGRLVARRSI